jgi:hypothetical protein
VPREAGMPMGQGAPRKTTEPTHEIFSDGTYSNAPTAEVRPVLPKVWDVFKTKSGSQYRVMHIEHGGVFVTCHPYDRQPRIDECEFWEMQKFISERVDG